MEAWPFPSSTSSRSASARAARTPWAPCGPRACLRSACSTRAMLAQDRARASAGLYGSLGATGKGHGSDKAVLLGLAGHEPDTVDVEASSPAPGHHPQACGRIRLLGEHSRGLQRGRPTWSSSAAKACPSMPTACALARLSMRAAWSWCNRTYYSVGGGFVVSEEVAADGSKQKVIAPDATVLPLPLHTAGDDLLGAEQARRHVHRRGDAPQ